MWALTRRPRVWQDEALRAWQAAGRQGIAKVVTGGGKTAFAEQCMLDFRASEPDAVFAVLVPSIALLDQWAVELADELGVSAEEMHFVRAGAQPRETARVHLAVINTARKHGYQLPAGHPSMLIADECHRAGSTLNQRALNGTWTARLGLSATPERQYDEALREVLVPRLGPVIFEYGYVEAHRDAVITDFSLANIEVPLTPSEEEDYARLSGRVRKLARKYQEGEPVEDRLKVALRQRAAVSSNAARRIPVAVSLVDAHRGQRALVFHESIAAAEEIHRLLRERGHNATLYHSRIADAMRRDNLRLFRRGVFHVLVSCRALDEGVNVPETEVGVIASSTASLRQRIQRLGRLLRPAAGKKRALVYTLYATQIEERRLADEAERLEGAAAVSWRKASFDG